ncbi:MAG: hypothetical protein AABX33_08380 [Nanoarchaeota archaeon]
MLLVSISNAQVPDTDRDGVSDSNDKCRNSQTTEVDPQGCSCEEKTCPSGTYCSRGSCIHGVQNNIVVQGEIEIEHSDDFQNPENSKYYYYLRTPTKRYELKYEKQSSFKKAGITAIDTQISFTKSGTRVKVKGKVSGNEILISAPIEIISGISKAAIVQDNLGPQSTLVIVAGIGDRPPPANIETVRDLVFGEHSGTANDYYIKNSYGKVSITGIVIGPYNLPSSIVRPNCDENDILNEVIRRVDSDVDFRSFSRIILIVPSTQCDNAGGRGSIGKRIILTNDGEIRASVSWDYSLNLHVVGHELGHNFGLHHANTATCLFCASNEQGDFFDIMGRLTMHMNAPHKEEAGWLSSANTKIINSENDYGEYFLKPLETQQELGIIQQIKLPLRVKPQLYYIPEMITRYFPLYDTRTNVYYTLEFRQPIDYDAGALSPKTYSGVFIHLSGEYPNSPQITYRTNLVNYELSGMDYETPLLQVGESFKDSANNYEISLLSANSNGAVVRIGPFTSTNQPPIGSFDRIEVTQTNRLAYGHASDPDTPNKPVSVVFYANGPIGTGEFLGSTVTFFNQGIRDIPYQRQAVGDYEFGFQILRERARGGENTVYAYVADSWNGDVAGFVNSPRTITFESCEISMPSSIGDQQEFNIQWEGPGTSVDIIAIYDRGTFHNRNHESLTPPSGISQQTGLPVTGSASGLHIHSGDTVSLKMIWKDQSGNQICDAFETVRSKVISLFKEPRLLINPITIYQGNRVTINISNAEPNADIVAYIIDINKRTLIDGSVIGITDETGKWSQEVDSTGWPLGTYNAYVIVGRGFSNYVEFQVIGSVVQCPKSFSGLSPTGIVRPTGDTTSITLSWQMVDKATGYNVRLYDGTSDRFDDTRIETCQNSQYYYCENGITSNSVDNIPVRRGRAYYFWVEPVVPGCGYFKGYTAFSVTNFDRLPSLSIFDVEANSKKITRGNSVSLEISDAPPNSPVYIALLDASGTLLGDILPLGSTQSDGTYRLEINRKNTAQWQSGSYNAYAIIYNSILNEYVVTNKAEAVVI